MHIYNQQWIWRIARGNGIYVCIYAMEGLENISHRACIYVSICLYIYIYTTQNARGTAESKTPQHPSSQTRHPRQERHPSLPRGVPGVIVCQTPADSRRLHQSLSLYFSFLLHIFLLLFSHSII